MGVLYASCWNHNYSSDIVFVCIDTKNGVLFPYVCADYLPTMRRWCKERIFLFCWDCACSPYSSQSDWLVTRRVNHAFSRICRFDQASSICGWGCLENESIPAYTNFWSPDTLRQWRRSRASSMVWVTKCRYYWGLFIGSWWRNIDWNRRNILYVNW